MMNKNISKLGGDEKGVSLIMAFFIMVIVLSVVLSVSALLYSEIKVIRNISNSIISFYAADSGIEKVLFYDRQVLSVIDTVDENPIFAPRGLCSMLSYCAVDDPGNPDHSIYCNTSDKDLDRGGIGGAGCDINTCENCVIYFDNKFDTSGDKTYSIEASVETTGNPSSDYYLIVKSDGAFADTGRQVQITISTQE